MNPKFVTEIVDPQKYIQLVDECFISNDFTNVVPYSKKIISLGEQNNDEVLTAKGDFFLGTVLSMHENFEQARVHLEKAKAVFEKDAQLNSYLGACLLEIAFLYRSTPKDPSLEYEYSLKAFELLNAIEKPSARDKKFLGYANYHLSLVYNVLGYFDDSFRHVNEAIKIAKQENDHITLATAHNLIANLYHKRGDKELAEKHFLLAYECKHQINKSLKEEGKLTKANIFSIAVTEANLGYFYIKLNQHEKAFKFLDSALKNSNSFEGQAGKEVRLKLEIRSAMAYEAVEKQELAIDHFKNAQEQALDLKDDDSLFSIYDSLRLIFEKKKDFQTAYHYSVKLNELSKKMLDNKNNKIIADLKVQYETQQKDAEIYRLKSQALEKSNEALDEFARVASHDMREPLRMINSYMGLLKRRYQDKLEGSAIEFIDFAVDGTHRMIAMIEDLLAYSKISSDEIKFSKVNLNEVVENVTIYLRKQIEEKNAILEFDHLPDVYAGQSEMIRLFQNLIGNGIKYNENKPPTIKIQVKELDKTYEFSIIDNGIGIDEEHQKMIFEPFRRLHSKAEYSGSGIGLSIVEKIVKRHNGTLNLDSFPGSGSTFRFTLPKGAS